LSDIDIPMQLGAVMSGQLRRSDNDVTGGTAEIVLFDDGYNKIGVASAFDGYYSTDAWLPGTYYLEALGYVQLTGCAFYLDRPCPDSGNPADADATPVTVAAGETRTGIDFHLPPADEVFIASFEF
jgi:hypothetical protein